MKTWLRPWAGVSTNLKVNWSICPIKSYESNKKNYKEKTHEMEAILNEF